MDQKIDSETENNSFKKFFPESYSSSKGEVKVNKVQFLHDSRWREFKFFTKQGHVFKHIIDRYKWFQYPKKYIVNKGFPLHVDIELSSTCQMKCPFCYTITDEFKSKVPRRFIDFDLFKRVIDECVENKIFSIRLSWRGEPLIHPQIYQILDYIKKSKIPNVSFISNGMAINKKLAEAIVDSGIAYFNVSIDGTGERYNRLRRPMTWEKIQERLKIIQETKTAMKSAKPLVRVCSVWPAISDTTEEWVNTLKPLSDKMVVNPFLDFGNPRPLNPKFVCQYLWQRLIVTIDGWILPCPGDVHSELKIANLSEMTLAQAWNCEKMQWLRKKHSSGCRTDIETCKKCHHGWVWDKDKLAKEKTWLAEKEIFN